MYPDEISSSQAAKILGLSTATLSTWRCRGGKSLPWHKRFGRVFYRESECRQFLVEQTKQGSYL